VIPQGLLDAHLAREGHPPEHAHETEAVERRAVDAVLAAERSIGRAPTEMPHLNPGYAVRSEREDGPHVRIEVKGRIFGADEFTITRNEVLTAKNLGDDYRLALVSVSPDGPENDQVRYLSRPFDGTDTADFRITRFTLGWRNTWEQGGRPR
jgi:hypothetical protein